jgi:hypothetical protein
VGFAETTLAKAVPAGMKSGIVIIIIPMRSSPNFGEKRIHF